MTQHDLSVSAETDQVPLDASSSIAAGIPVGANPTRRARSVGSYILQRLFHTFFVLCGTATIVFVILRVIPGDPAQFLAGTDAPAASVEAIRHQLGTDRPLFTQYLDFVANAIKLDFGQSFRLGESARSAVLSRYPFTLTLAVPALLIGLLVGVPLGIVAARRPNGWIDRLITVSALVGQSLPGFVVGLVFILVFARLLGWLPSYGIGGWQHLILPAVTLALPFMSLLIRLVRGGLLDVMSKDYILMARSKGFSDGLVIRVHALRNVAIPVVTVLGLQLGHMIAGAIIVETVFSRPGLGLLLINAIRTRDYPVVQAAVITLALTFVLLNLLVDLLYPLIDPRIRLA
jgi:ABC-type dipeptide/oligopeptide/nickel transport system permease component